MEAMHMLDNWRKVIIACGDILILRHSLSGSDETSVQRAEFLSLSFLAKAVLNFSTFILFPGIFLPVISCGSLRWISFLRSVRGANIVILRRCFAILRAEYIRTVFSIPAAQHFRHTNGCGCALILCDRFNDVFSHFSREVACASSQPQPSLSNPV